MPVKDPVKRLLVAFLDLAVTLVMATLVAMMGVIIVVIVAMVMR